MLRYHKFVTLILLDDDERMILMMITAAVYSEYENVLRDTEHKDSSGNSYA